MLVERSGDEFTTSVYRKPTFTGEYVRWDSFCDRRRKLNLIKTLAHRARLICSPQNLAQEIDKIKALLIGNGYPENTVHNVIRNTMAQPLDSGSRGPVHEPAGNFDDESGSDSSSATGSIPDSGRVRVASSGEETTANDEVATPSIECDSAVTPSTAGDRRSGVVYLLLLYLGAVSAAYRRRIKDTIGKCYKDVVLRLLFKSTPNFPNAKKDVLPTLHRSNVVYDFVCHCGSRYVGRTSKRLIERVKQHIPLKLQGMIGTPAASNESPSSAIGAHFVESPECWSKYTTDRFGIVSFARTDCHLKALESLYISGQKPVLCRQKRFIYSCILFKHFSC